MQRKKSKAKATPSPPAPVGVDKDAVVRLAYEFYVRRGGEHGHDVEDWLMAGQMRERKKRSGPARQAYDAMRRREGKFYR